MTDLSLASPASARRPFSVARLAPYGFALSLALLALAGGSLATRGLNLGLDFTGGVMLDARSEAGFDTAALRAGLAAQGLPEASVQLSDGGHAAIIRVQGGAGQAQAAKAALGPGAEIRAEAVVGPRVSGDLMRSGATSCLLAVLSIAVYVWLRFELRFALSAFLTTLHDLCMMVGLYAVTGMSFDLTSVAALLMIAGYSINDTVVVFDRLREVIARAPGIDLRDAIDRSASSTLRRTLMTSGSTAAASVALWVFGGPALEGLAAAITFGIAAGTLSSIFVAAPLLLHLPGALPGRATPAAEDRP